MSRKRVWKKYRREVKATLLCLPKEKRRILKEMRLGADLFLEKNPEADFNDLKQELGDPQEIAAEYLQAHDAMALCRKLKVIKFIKLLIAILAFCFIATYGGAMLYEFFIHTHTYGVAVSSPL